MKKSKKSRFSKKILISLLFASSILFSSCEKKQKSVLFTSNLPSETRGTVMIAGHYANFEALEAEFDRFNEYYPNITLSYEFLDDYNRSILPALKGEAAPDIFFTFNWMLDKREYDEVFNSAENLSDPAVKINLTALRQELLMVHSDGQIRMAPVLVNTYGMLVNRDLLKKYEISVPKTYKNLKKAIAKLKENGFPSPVFGYNNSTGLIYSLALPYFCNSISTIPGSVPLLNSLDSEAGKYLKPVLDFTEDFMQTGAVDFEFCGTLKNNYNDVIMRFFNGDIPIVFANGDLVSGTKKREKQSSAFTENPFAYSFYPIPVNDKGGFFLNFPSVEFSVNKNSKNLEAANEFMRFLLTTQELNNLSKIKRLVTASTDFSLDEVYSAFGEATPIYFDRIGIMDNVVKQMRTAVWLVANKKMTAEETMKNFGSILSE